MATRVFGPSKHFLGAFVRNKGAAWRIARIIVLIVFGTIALVMIFEEKLIFFPAKYPDGIWAVNDLAVREGETAPVVEDCWFLTADGLRLHGWLCVPYRKSKGELIPVGTRMTLLWFHGNAGNLSHRYEMIRMLIGIPVQIFIIDYRGYGRSEGSPSEAGLYEDARAAWSYLTSERGISPDRIIVLGKSLGGVPAVDLASKVEPAGLIVQSSFTSAADMAAAVLPFYPRFLLRSKMDSASKIGSVRCPKLFVHSPADEIVPFALGRKLYERAPEPKEFYEVAGAPHNSTYIVGGKPYLEALRRFVERCTP